MQAVVTQPQPRKLADEYLGYEVQWLDGKYLAIPMGWHGEVIQAETLPELRKKIWRWWHQV